jgi:hypothetical protein
MQVCIYPHLHWFQTLEPSACLMYTCFFRYLIRYSTVVVNGHEVFSAVWFFTFDSKDPVAMSRAGSVFLGDVQRHRIISTPPSSPSLSPPSSVSHSMSSILNPTQPTSPSSPPASKPTAIQPAIDPVLSLELRLRWLEALLLGVRQDVKGTKVKEMKHGETLVRLAEEVQRRLNAVVSSNEGLKRFMDHCLSYISHSSSVNLSGFPSSQMIRTRIFLHRHLQCRGHCLHHHLHTRICLYQNWRLS